MSMLNMAHEEKDWIQTGGFGAFDMIKTTLKYTRATTRALAKLPFSNVFALRKRYVFTKTGVPRLRYMCALLTALATLGLIGSNTPSSSIIGTKGMELASYTPDQSEYAGHNNYEESVLHRISHSMRSATDAIRKPEHPTSITLKLGKGDTVAGILQNAGISSQDTYNIVKNLNEHHDLRKAKPGQSFEVKLKQSDNENAPEFERISMKITPVKEIVVEKQGEEYVTDILEAELTPKTNARYAKITTSLYGSAARSGIPSPVIAKMIRLYSHSVDFQRDIQPGDRVEVMYETNETEDGSYKKYGDIIYANLNIAGKKYPIYRFETNEGNTDYFKEDGKTIKNTLLRTPVDGARMSSGFGMRHHPVLGYNKMHKGVDFAASTGTPIYAAGKGKITFAGRKGGYGNYISIRHNGEFSTAYAHMHKFAKGMHAGKTVKQGDIIGYVGTTGRSTGPHLHYEVLKNGKQVNPRGVDLPLGEELKGKDLEKFKTVVAGIQQRYASLTENYKTAALNAQ